MKMRTVTTEYLLAMWEGAISMTLFPEALFDKLRPLDILNSWGDDLPAMREKCRAQVDTFIEQVLDCDTPEEHWKSLGRIDSKIMALYCDRLNAATYALKALKKEKEAVEIPSSWTTLVAQLLLQMSPQ
jgi:hypothetical protein